ncbi:phosphoribosylformimino-5-aminoimidazole carboxamide ribotide isomerase [Sulfuriroseicoccus oceanibius]|uniref:Phosphoribosylformimino-5-aminoimidazole carboxamide ribotide isomerase n=2 Tax=Sulfuriroseicoccus oceanibius TaxID=2707525 RepID=A0A7T7F444_9BACT|nr:phosphoribosylformimino-5-aminoimidazole carboxamide ribotide isomerase [Sulfuriroseicoccus oceanibius]
MIDEDVVFGGEAERRWVDGDGVGVPRFANALSYGVGSTSFRPCIDLHSGQVKQIVGGSLTDDGEGLKTNFVSERDAAWFAAKYKQDALRGGHVIKLGPGNDEAARSALAAYPGGLQIGGGITAENAAEWIAAGASHVIVTSYLFDSEGKFRQDRLDALVAAVGRERLVIDLSCRRQSDGGWVVAMNRWQTLTDMTLNRESLERLAEFCDEFLIHAADVEGMCGGIDEELVQALGEWSPIPVTYAGGARSIDDLELVNRLSNGHVDLTIGSALDLFGGDLIRYDDCVAFNREGEKR